MSLYTFVYDSSTGKKRAVAYPGFVDTVAAGAGSANVGITGVTIDANHAIDAWVAGRMQTENTHYTRDVAGQRLVFSASIPSGDEVRIRVYLK